MLAIKVIMTQRIYLIISEYCQKENSIANSLPDSQAGRLMDILKKHPLPLKVVEDEYGFSIEDANGIYMLKHGIEYSDEEGKAICELVANSINTLHAKEQSFENYHRDKYRNIQYDNEGKFVGSELQKKKEKSDWLARGDSERKELANEIWKICDSDKERNSTSRIAVIHEIEATVFLELNSEQEK